MLPAHRFLKRYVYENLCEIRRLKSKITTGSVVVSIFFSRSKKSVNRDDLKKENVKSNSRNSTAGKIETRFERIEMWIKHPNEKKNKRPCHILPPSITRSNYGLKKIVLSTKRPRSRNHWHVSTRCRGLCGKKTAARTTERYIKI